MEKELLIQTLKKEHGDYLVNIGVYDHAKKEYVTDAGVISDSHRTELFEYHYCNWQDLRVFMNTIPDSFIDFLKNRKG